MYHVTIAHVVLQFNHVGDVNDSTITIILMNKTYPRVHLLLQPCSVGKVGVHSAYAILRTTTIV